jgi:hypothetical protein
LLLSKANKVFSMERMSLIKSFLAIMVLPSIYNISTASCFESYLLVFFAMIVIINSQLYNLPPDSKQFCCFNLLFQPRLNFFN